RVADVRGVARQRPCRQWRPERFGRGSRRGGAGLGAGRARRRIEDASMITSMTGFASATHETELATVSVSVKSVNHRFLDVQFRLPQAVPFAETALRSIVQRHVARGRVEVTAHVQMRRSSAPAVEINEGFVAALAQAVETARAKGFVEGTLSPADLLRFP